MNLYLMPAYGKITQILVITALSTAALCAQDIETIGKQTPLSSSGSVTASLMYYDTKGAIQTYTPWSWVLSGRLDPVIYGIAVPISFTYSKADGTFDQPFSRFGLSPKYKWATLHLGYRNVSFSRFTLAGHSVLGAGLELNPGKLRFGAVYGRFSEKHYPRSINPADTLELPTRKGFAVKLGLGNEKQYFDLIFTSIKDNADAGAGQEYISTSPPEGNNVFGVHTVFNLAKNLKVEVEGALSLLTHNLNAEDIADSTDVPGIIQDLAGDLDLNTSSDYSTALTSSLTYAKKSLSLGLQYQRIDPGYRSFGAYYFNTDLENVTLNSRFRALKKTLSIAASAGVQHDNLK
ncbi:MAG: hypothetical protein IH599_00850, partial [Bacteroidales bacterium]|nr:hypothetical protein [Bacteroidales bacterium]